jgi:Transglycosylase SLT domain
VIKFFTTGLLLIAFAITAWAADTATPQMKVVYDAVLRNGFNIRYDHQQQLQGVTRLYLAGDPGSGFVDVPTEEIMSVEREEIPLPPAPAAAPAASRQEVERWVNSASDQHQIDADLIRSVIKAESGFNSRAVSPKGAQGLMQLMPATAGQLGVKDAFAPNQNIDGGTRYLRDLLVLYNNDMIKALAAYNAGPQRVEQYHGVPPYRETHAYVARVINDFNRAKLAARNSSAQSNARPAAAGGSGAKASTRSTNSASKASRTQAAGQSQPQAKPSKPTVSVAN